MVPDRVAIAYHQYSQNRPALQFIRNYRRVYSPGFLRRR